MLYANVAGGIDLPVRPAMAPEVPTTASLKIDSVLASLMVLLVLPSIN